MCLSQSGAAPCEADLATSSILIASSYMTSQRSFSMIGQSHAGLICAFFWLFKLAEWPQNHGPTDRAFVEKDEKRWEAMPGR